MLFLRKAWSVPRQKQKTKIWFQRSKKWFRISLLLFVLVIIFNTFISFWKIKTVRCQGVEKQQAAFIAQLVKANLEGRPLLFISKPEVEAIIKPLYLWQVTSIRKIFPSTLEISCRQLGNKAYFFLTNYHYSQPATLGDWYKLDYEVWRNLNLQRPFLLVFGLSSGRIINISHVLQVGDSRVVFGAYDLGQKEYQAAWKGFFWLRDFDTDSQNKYKVFIFKNNLLITDNQRGISYLLDANNLPKPEVLREFVDSLTAPYPLIIDWRGSKLVTWR